MPEKSSGRTFGSSREAVRAKRANGALLLLLAVSRNCFTAIKLLSASPTAPNWKTACISKHQHVVALLYLCSDQGGFVLKCDS